MSFLVEYLVIFSVIKLHKHSNIVRYDRAEYVRRRIHDFAKESSV
mgnify:CR=1 FL=1